MHMEKLANRYSRQQRLFEIGKKGQQALNDSVVTIIGCGALGCAVAELLARAGVGTLVLVDRDTVEVSNLQRQQLFDEQAALAGTVKVEAAKARIHQINSSITVKSIVQDVTTANAEQLILAENDQGKSSDVIIDGLDNFAARFIINDVAVKHGIPYVYGAGISTFGSFYTVLPKDIDPDGFCLRCMFPDEVSAGLSPNCNTAGILGSVISLVAANQATQAIKILTGAIDAVNRQLVALDPWYNVMQQIEPKKSAKIPICPCCQSRDFEYLSSENKSGPSWMCGQETIQISPKSTEQQLNFEKIAQNLSASSCKITPFMMRYSTQKTDKAIEFSLFRNGRALIRGVATLDDAQRLYNQILEL